MNYTRLIISTNWNNSCNLKTNQTHTQPFVRTYHVCVWDCVRCIFSLNYLFWFCLQITETIFSCAFIMNPIVKTCALFLLTVVTVECAQSNPIGKWMRVSKIEEKTKQFHFVKFAGDESVLMCFSWVGIVIFRHWWTDSSHRGQRCLINMCDNGIIFQRHRSLASW